MKIVSIGGGPAGLYFALLMKQQTRGTIVVVERNPAPRHLGWGASSLRRDDGQHVCLGPADRRLQ